MREARHTSLGDEFIGSIQRKTQKRLEFGRLAKDGSGAPKMWRAPA